MAGSLPRGPLQNEMDLLEEVNGYIYSLVFWLPTQLGLPTIPPLFGASQIKVGTGPIKTTYSFQ